MLNKHKIIVTKTEDMCVVKRTNYTQTVRPYMMACIVKNVVLTVDSMKKFIQLQTKLHDTICDKRNAATIATHDLDACKGRKFAYTALSPDGLQIMPLSRNKEMSGRGMNAFIKRLSQLYIFINKHSQILQICSLNCKRKRIIFEKRRREILTPEFIGICTCWRTSHSIPACLTLKIQSLVFLLSPIAS